MSTYNHFLGVDIGKHTFVSAVYGLKVTKEYENTDAGIEKFYEEHKQELKAGLCVLETTGGYEMELLISLCKKGMAMHRANTRNVKSFIRSYGVAAKTDALDAKALASYGKERHGTLPLFKPISDNMEKLCAFSSRRNDLKKALVAEKNRKHSTRNQEIKDSCDRLIEAITAEIEEADKQISDLIALDANLSKRKEVLQGIPGIGEITANNLLVAMPELGTVRRRQITSLAGLAPRANDSGIRRGYRSTNKGRAGVKPILFMAAMAARRSQSDLGAFYERLIKKGTKKMVALT